MHKKNYVMWLGHKIHNKNVAVINQIIDDAKQFNTKIFKAKTLENIRKNSKKYL